MPTPSPSPTVNPTVILPIPSPTPTITLPTTQPTLRNYLAEGQEAISALNQLSPNIYDLYQRMAGQYTQADLNRLTGMLGMAPGTSYGQMVTGPGGLTDIASLQTQASNAALRAANLADVQGLSGQAREAFIAANPELQAAQAALTARGTAAAASPYEAALSQYFMGGPTYTRVGAQAPTAAQIAAGTGGTISAGSLQNPLLSAVQQQAMGAGLSPLEQQMQARALEQMALGGSLSAEDIRNAQQAAREAYGARGQVMSQGAAAQEVLNRQALSQQRLAERMATAQQVNQQLQAAQQARNQFGLGVIGAGQAATAQDIQTQLANQQAALDIARLNQQAQMQAGMSGSELALRAALANQATGQTAQQQTVALGQALSAADLARQQQNIANAMQNIQLQSAAAFNPFQTILGQQYGMQTQNIGTNAALAAQLGGLGAGAGGYGYVQQAYAPYNAYGQDVFGTNVNAVNAAIREAANRQAALEAAKMGQTGAYAQTLAALPSALQGISNTTSGFVQALEKLFGGGGTAPCWVAREVYGEDNPKWLVFRHWVLFHAPDWFRDGYMKHGPQIAEWLKQHPVFKLPVRVFMDSRIDEMLRVASQDEIDHLTSILSLKGV